MQDMIIMWIYKFIEILICCLFGYVVYFIINILLNNTLAVISLSIILYFFGGLLRPIFKEIQDNIFKEIKK